MSPDNPTSQSSVTPALRHFQRVGSTMDVLHQMAAEGAPAGTVVIAGEQLEGRGSRGRSWHSPVGGLWLSVLFRPAGAGAAEVISLRVGLAVADAMESLDVSVQVKWPNDLMLEERKVGGVLCEARWQGETLGWVAVGIGMNIRNPIPTDLSPTAVTLAEMCPGITVDMVADALVPRLRGIGLDAGRLTEEELERFSGRDWLRGRRLRAPVGGTAAGLRDDGALLVRTDDETEVPLRSGSVELAAGSHSR